MLKHAGVVIIGSGTAGLSALREVQRKTHDFVLINAGDWGTTCAARGCMPSKALIEAANAFHRRHDFAAFGLKGAEGVSADIPAVLARVRRLRDDFVKGPEAVPGQLGKRAISGRARLLGPDRVVVEGHEISARRIILAPGSRPLVPKQWARFGDRILTTDTLFEQTDLPRRIAVIGMGAIGIEMAQALSRLGVEVAGFDAVEGLAGLTDVEVTEVLRTAIVREFPLYLGAAAELTDGNGCITVTSARGSFSADAVLVAIGRRPNIDDIGLETLGVDLDEKGMPRVDPTTLQIGDTPVFLAGDANAFLGLLHEAADEGHIAGRNAVTDVPKAYCRRTEMAIVFASPAVARVGKRLADLDRDTTAIGSADFSRQGRARTAERAEGLLRIYADKHSAKLSGAEMCVPAAEHMAHLLVLAMQQALTVHDMLAMPFYHPVLEEGLRSALRDLARQVPGGGGSDLSDCPQLGIDALE
jgi:dihydrolipoamide dehydrogenase